MADTTGTETVERAGLWRRVAALLIDVCLITGILGLIGIVLFEPTGGYLRVSTALIHSNDCRPEKEVRIPVPKGLAVTHAFRCTKTLLGHVFDRQVTVAEVTKSGSVTYTRSYTASVDPSGAPMQAFYLDSLSGYLLAAYLLFLEWRFGRTLGKDLMKVRVRALGGGSLTFGQSAIRVLIRLLPILAAFLIWLLRPLGTSLMSPTAYSWTGLSLVGAVALAQAINFILTTRKRVLPWHDWFTGTEVVRGR